MTTHVHAAMPSIVRNAADRAHRAEPAPPRAVGQFDELVLHDLLNPMTGVLGQLEMLEDQLKPSLAPSDRQRLEQCLGSARDLSDMLVNLRHLYHLQATPDAIPPTSTSVQALLQFLRDAHEWPFGAEIAVATTLDHAQVHVRDDGQLLRRAMYVLGQAALRLSGDGRVEFGAQTLPATGRVRLSCRWHGRPLPEPLSYKMFTSELASVQRDYGLRIDRARAMELVSRTVQHLNGTADYEPESDGGAFVVDVPRIDPTEIAA